MTQDQIVAILQTNYPGAHWKLDGNTYEHLTWLDNPATKPTAQNLGL